MSIKHANIIASLLTAGGRSDAGASAGLTPTVSGRKWEMDDIGRRDIYRMVYTL